MLKRSKHNPYKNIKPVCGRKVSELATSTC